MSDELTLREKDMFRMIQSECHIGSRNYNVQMKRYIHHFNSKGIPVFNLNETYDKMRLAARIIAGQRPEEVMCVSSRESGQRAVVKFAQLTGCSVAPSGKWCSGTLTNHQTKNFMEPKLLVVVDPYADFKPIKEGSLINIPVISLCDTKNSLKYIDVVIPCNNDNTQSIAQIFWLLAREVQLLTGVIDSAEDFEEVVDLFDNRDLTKKEKEDDSDEEDEDDDDDDEDDDDDDNEEVVEVEDDDDEDEDDDDEDEDDTDWNTPSN